MIASALTKLTGRRAMLTQARGVGNLPQYNPASTIPMSYGGVILIIVGGFSALAYLTNPFRHANIDKLYTVKYQQK